MKRSILFVPVLLFFVACNFSKGVKKDLGTGLTTTYNGFHVDDTYMQDGDGTKLTSNKVPLGTKLMLVASGVSNFTAKDGKVHPGIRIVVTDAAGKEVLSVADAFAGNTDGFKPEEATRLMATLTTGAPMVAGATYTMNATFFDKQNKENLIVSEVKLEMK